MTRLLTSFSLSQLRTAFILLICSLCHVVNGQNLVTNGDFEAYNKCPWDITGIDYSPTFTSFPTVKNWVRPTHGTTDYFNRCATGPRILVPDNEVGYQVPRSGDGYAGIGIYQHPVYLNREFLTTKLNRRLLKDSLYCLRFFVSPSIPKRRRFGADYHSVAISDLGASFTDTIPGPMGMYGDLVLPYHVQNDTARYFTDTSLWYEIQGVYMAKGSEQWLTLGSLSPQYPPYLHLNGPNNGDPVSYFYVDDVSMEQVVAPDLLHQATLCTPTITLSSSKLTGPYIWNTGDTTRSIQVNSPGNYTCYSYNACIAFRDRFVIDPMPQSDSVHDTVVICEVTPRTAVLSAAQTTGSFLWSTGDTTRTLLVDQAGIYVCSTVRDCKLFIDSFFVVLDSARTPVVRDTMICQHVPAPMLAVEGPALIWYAELNGSGSSQQPFINTGKGGSTTLYVARQERSCTSRKMPLTITVKELPATHPAELAFRCADGTQSYIVIGKEGASDDLFSWNTGATSCCINPQQAGRYIRTAGNICGTVTDTFYLASRECDSCIYFPNAFSPNGDGVNDGFRAMKLCQIKEFHFEVFNRWGRLVYQSDRIEDRWNGEHGGVPAPAGTYMYFASFTTSLSEKKYIVKGAIMLLR